MTKNLLRTLAFIGCASLPLLAFSAPDAGKNQRWVIRLPAVENEDALKIEVIVGKTLTVNCNQQWFNGSLTETAMDKWGAVYYQLGKTTGPMSTRVACPGQSPKEAFVRVRGKGFLLNYSSKLPPIIFAPKDFDVRYRIWRGDEKMETAVKE